MIDVPIGFFGEKWKAARQPMNFDEDGNPISGRKTIETLREVTDTILLAFSRGKDSIAVWLTMREYDFKIIPFFMYDVPGLKFIEESLAYFEDFFGQEILSVPSPSFYRMLKYFVFQPPNREIMIEAMRLPEYKSDDLHKLFVHTMGLPETTFVASGVRAIDSPRRRANMSRTGPINWKRQMAYPIWDIRRNDQIKLIADSGCKLPIDYRLFGRSFDGIDYRFVKPLEEFMPADYGRILEWFPLVRLELARYDVLRWKDENEKETED